MKVITVGHDINYPAIHPPYFIVDKTQGKEVT